MKIISILTVLLLCSGCASKLELGFYSAMDKTMKVFDFDRSADRVIRYSVDEMFDIDIGNVEDDCRDPITFKYSEIRYFLEQEKHKDLAVVWFDKSVMWNKEEVIDKHVRSISSKLERIGYSRVVILGAHSAGVHYVYDTKVNKKAEPEDGIDE